MLEYLTRLLFERGLAPHGFCLLWDPALIWTHVVADALIGAAYFSIPVVLGVFLARRRDVQFSWVVWLFAAFIMACGITHLMSIVVLWNPIYGIQALLKIATAIVSVATAVSLWPLLPRALALPSPAQLALANGNLVERIRERDDALAALQRETADRERAEDRLRQSLKMEAVGQLTGGIAHDFNNLLTVIAGNLERALRLSPDNAPVQRALASAMDGTDRAALLTRQLLAFSSQQALQPAPEDLNLILSGMRDLLEQSLVPDHAILFDLAPALPAVTVDRVQTETVILNLAVNARDAMPSGGRLTFTTRAEAHQVVLTVTDTGVGMADDVRSRVFEPFFTTKALGQGTGLGMSQVYGFIKQSGGEIAIESAPGVGTTITLSLPIRSSAA
ncbi:MAG: hypothetical protein RL490_366 [Pseudomonadota bacterium]|jgi:signal transduction histidine kinase